MTPEEIERLETCTKEIAKILYRNAEAIDADVNEINRFIGLPEEENSIAETIDLTGI
ncbi:MAG: hypothetical protein ACK5EU_17850 [Pseudanabaena sp.]|jgi:hypothetical protein|uniref:hypothetical protein n=1 Tax=Pseudanabaena mucicola TaxID=71190 RepID=UPI002576CC5B|nr:hypothetical protein [Pseudanabaena mucicola]MCA6573803.1 hypothetical protein [Pseudanabaena sp. M53BS1SP1A06MG]MCA6581777.1 hypothetical protein [Pseudanabaena sp. M34BS1SP1A06MG]MCA6586561.1 hypothetical protein [Pseudanabaena sp. M051S1SP1A06QC]MCA6594499.1 hypothetical protein [Pseudanabaena sp. M38BS1SP1A06MG]MCA6595617.1 hypothetical protein [Pseudanabaena sp. M046S1SP1A06QC]MCA6600930.1 hypothetical protein [Pseudanabaena sp. M57BS1SP1A06MG]MCA6603781.1 hypothetical protein [Pseud